MPAKASVMARTDAGDSGGLKEGRRERRGRELRQRIFSQAQRLFLEHGFENTTVNQIAEAADVAPATFFNHFQSKAALFEAVTGEVLEYLQGILDEEFAREATTQARIRAFADRVAVEILNVRELAHDALLGLIHTGTPSGQVALHASGIRAPFASMLREGQQKGEVRADLDATFLAEIVIGALNACITNWLGDYEYPLADRLRETATFMGEAIQERSD
jgi:AcrR family transcriptional regulator